MKDEKIIELLQKLKRLVDAGVDGEKENAMDMLQRLMDKHGVTLADITGEDEKTLRWFEIKTTQKKLFFQVVASVIGGGIKYSCYKGSRKDIGLMLTTPEFIEIKAKFEFYSEAYERDLKIFYEAFIQKNQLFTKPSGEDQVQKPLSEEELERLRRMLSMMGGLEEHMYRKQLN